MPRFEPVPSTTKDPVVRLGLSQAAKRLGRVPEPFAVAAHSKASFLGQAAFELALERAHRVPARVKELAVLRSAMVVGCEFCCDIGSFLSRAHGVTEDDLRALADPGTWDRFSPEERTALELAQAMSRTPEETTDALVAQAVAQHGEAGAVELVTAIAWENFRARANAAFGIGAQGFSEGAFCVRPDRDAGGVPA
jgi:AhpD family alkylhydroperoxidase